MEEKTFYNNLVSEFPNNKITRLHSQPYDYEDTLNLIRVTMGNENYKMICQNAFEKVYAYWESAYRSREDDFLQNQDVNEKRKNLRSKLLDVILSDDWEEANPKDYYQIQGNKIYDHACKLFDISTKKYSYRSQPVSFNDLKM